MFALVTVKVERLVLGGWPSHLEESWSPGSLVLPLIAIVPFVRLLLCRATRPDGYTGSRSASVGDRSARRSPGLGGGLGARVPRGTGHCWTGTARTARTRTRSRLSWRQWPHRSSVGCHAAPLPRLASPWRHPRRG